MNIKKDDLWTFEDVCKYGQDNSRWLCIGANGKDYEATFTRKYNRQKYAPQSNAIEHFVKSGRNQGQIPRKIKIGFSVENSHRGV